MLAPKIPILRLTILRIICSAVLISHLASFRHLSDSKYPQNIRPSTSPVTVITTRCLIYLPEFLTFGFQVRAVLIVLIHVSTQSHSDMKCTPHSPCCSSTALLVTAVEFGLMLRIHALWRGNKYGMLLSLSTQGIRS